MQLQATRNLPRHPRLLLALCAILAAGLAKAALTDNVWQGSNNGNLTDNSNWAEGSAPSGTERAVIDGSLGGGSPVIVNANRTIGGLHLASGFALTRLGSDSNNRTLTIQADPRSDAYFYNAGTISSGGTAGNLAVNVNSGSGSTYTNIGIIEASAGTTLAFARGQNTPGLSNTAGTIRTAGNGILNLGNANSLPISGGSLANLAGTLNYNGKAALALTDVAFTNGGTANFFENSTNNSQGYGLSLSGSSSFTNTGTFNLTRDPAINTNTGASNAAISSSASTTSINNSGIINISAVSDSVISPGGFAGFNYTGVAQTLTNDGTINLESRSTTHNVVFSSTIATGDGVTIDGEGELVMQVGSGGSVSRVLVTGSNGRITQNADHTLRGAGNLGANQLNLFTNHGTVLADDPAYALTLDPRGGQASFANVGSFANQGTLRASAAGGLILNDGKYTNDGIFLVDAGSSLTLNAGAVLANQIGRTIAIHGTWANGSGGLIDNAGSLLYDSSATSAATVGLTGSGTFTKEGSGTLALDGANSLTGGLLVADGILTVGADGASTLAASTTNNTFTVTLTAGDTSNLVVGQLVGGTGLPANARITGITSPTTFTLDRNATSTQASTTLAAAAYSALGDGPLTIAGGTLDLGGLSHLGGPLIMTGGTLANGILTAISYTGHSGTITADLAGPIGLEKITAGTLDLAGPSSYSGGTTVAAGMLLVNNTSGSATGSGPVAVNGGTFGGSGTIAGRLTVAAGATLAPGNSPGILTVGELDLRDGSTFTVELLGPTAGSGYDQVVVTGDFVKIETGAILDLVFGYSAKHGDSFLIIDNQGSDTTYGGLFTYGSTLLTEGATFQVGAYLFDITYAHAGGSVLLTVLIPEPTSLALLALASLGLLRRRRA